MCFYIYEIHIYVIDVKNSEIFQDHERANFLRPKGEKMKNKHISQTREQIRDLLEKLRVDEYASDILEQIRRMIDDSLNDRYASTGAKNFGIAGEMMDALAKATVRDAVSNHVYIELNYGDPIVKWKLTRIPSKSFWGLQLDLGHTGLLATSQIQLRDKDRWVTPAEYMTAFVTFVLKVLAMKGESKHESTLAS